MSTIVTFYIEEWKSELQSIEKEGTYMKSQKARNDLSIKAKNGIGFISSAVIIWTIITIIFLFPLSIQQKNIYMLISTGMMFPLSIGISSLIKADWKLEGNPLGNLGLILNLAQLIYFPLLFWAIIYNPEDAVIFFAIITAAHFFPYGWFYNAKPYYIMAPVVSVSLMLLGIHVTTENLWLVPFFTLLSFVILIFLLTRDFKKK